MLALKVAGEVIVTEYDRGPGGLAIIYRGLISEIEWAYGALTV